ncbi:pyridoxamine 5'-phosphate oxidase family protein [Clostridium sp.]|uniref:pyridoxamine 5'-phosphate oxidase family protein n=1 Tax=Clostridium sp. TaxID=1506 RepID=UPI002851A1D7|nr:pyridoxamine 5'-phosphate oxidase family protein [Clostridium sp.]MDR3595691.1 pyridoxamine 5'-phosphate oxidase family protein [Clostridium sp.]
MTIENILELLPNGSMGIFSTINEKGIPDGRGWQFLFEEAGKFYFATNNTKDVYKEMIANPNVAVTAMEPTGKHTVRITGKATFITDKSEKEQAYAKLDKIVKGIYKSWDDPILEIFYVSNGELKLARGFSPVEVIAY